MHVVHVVNGYLPEESGGTQVHVKDLCRAQSRRGLETHVFTRAGDPGREDFSIVRDVWEGVPVTRLTNNFLDCDRFSKLYTHPIIDDRFREFLAELRPDLVHIHHLTCLSTSMIEVARELAIPVVMTLHDYWLVCPRGQRIHPDDMSICKTLDRQRCLPCLRKLWPHLLPAPSPPPAPDTPLPGDPSALALGAWESHVLRMLALCDATITPSAFHRERLVEAGLPRERSHVVVNGLPTADLLAEPRGRLPIRHVGFIGTVIPSKGVHVLIEAFGLLDRKDLILDIHGEASPYHEKHDYLKELEAAVRPGLTVRFHGRYETSDLPRILAGLDLLVVTSLWWESFCLTAREGALAGLPVIAFEVGGLEEAVSQGLVVGCPVGDARELAGVIRRLCDDEELRDEMSRKAHLVHDIAQCAAEIEEVYQGVLADGRSRGAETTVTTPAGPGVSLFIPTWNAGSEFPEILRLMLDQELDRELEVVVIDSGSTDGTVEFLETQPVKLLRIPNSEFNHGLTRNRGIEETRGEIVVLATQDARPHDRHWMQRLVDCFDDPEVAGAYSCQVPRPDANPFIKDRLSNWAAAQQEPRVQRIDSLDEFEALAPLEKLGRVAFDNVSSSVRRSVALEIPFRERQFGEDLDWGHRAILAGHKIVFEPRSKVVHSHNNSIWYELKRVYLDHQNLNRLFGVLTIPRKGDLIACTKAQILHLWGVVDREPGFGPWRRLYWRLKAIPFGFSQNLAQYLGARSVWTLREGRWIDRVLDSLLRRGV